MHNIEAIKQDLTLYLLSCIIRSMNDNVLLSTKEAAIRLRLSQDHVRRLLENGVIRGKKIGNSWVVFDLSYVRQRRHRRSRK